MFKLDGSVDRYLFVKPGYKYWSIRSSLDAGNELIRSGSAGESCPAHPSNISFHRKSFNINNWEFNKAGENQDENFEEGGVIVRCSTHNADHAQWLLEQGREGKMEKEKVGALLCEEDKGGSFLLSLADFDVQIEAAVWNREATNKIAHKMSADFIQWLISQANEGKWPKEEVSSIVCRKNADNRLVLATLDVETQKQAAMFDKEKTNEIAHLLSADFHQWLIQQANEGKWPKEEAWSIICKKNADNQLILATLEKEVQKEVAVFNKSNTVKAVPYMDTDFLQWLYQEAVEGRWEKLMVFEAVVKEELDGKASFSPRIKPGRTIGNFLPYPMISTYL